MGEFAEAILDGLFCEGCGEVLDDMMDDDAQPPGHPRRCGKSTCRHGFSLQNALKRPMISPPSNARATKAARVNRERHEIAKERKPFECGKCRKLFRTEGGLAQHKRDTHDKPQAVRR